MGANTGITLDLADNPDRRLVRAAAKLASEEAALPGVGVTVVLPRPSFSWLLGRLMHEHTAGKIAAVVSQIQHPTATIVAFDVRGRPTRKICRSCRIGRGSQEYEQHDDRQHDPECA